MDVVSRKRGCRNVCCVLLIGDSIILLKKKKKKRGEKKRQGSLTSANYMVKLVTLAANNKAAVAMCIAVVGCTAITVPSIHIVAFCCRIREIH